VKKNVLCEKGDEITRFDGTLDNLLYNVFPVPLETANRFSDCILHIFEFMSLTGLCSARYSNTVRPVRIATPALKSHLNLYLCYVSTTK
jgi:hypothetical protein